MPARVAMSILPVIFMLVYLGIFIYLISLASRFVRAVEMIAEKFKQG